MTWHNEIAKADEDGEGASRKLYPRDSNGTTSHHAAELKRDDVYYLSDGSCVLRVEDTLFNVGVRSHPFC